MGLILLSLFFFSLLADIGGIIMNTLKLLIAIFYLFSNNSE